MTTNFNFIRDLARVAAAMNAPFAMIVEPSFPAKRFQVYRLRQG
jgi:hypothetical protein